MEQERELNQEYPRFSCPHENTSQFNEAELRQLEEQLRECEQLLDTTLNMADLGVWKLSFGTNAVLSSAKGKAHLGYSAEVQLTHAMLDESIISAVDRAGQTMHGNERIVQNMLEALQNQKEYYRECQVKWPDSSLHWLEITSKALPGRCGKPCSIVVVTQDITARKQEKQRKDTYLSTVRHELKTPLTTIKGFTQLLRRRMNKLGLAEQGAMLTRIEEQVDLMNQLVNEMRDGLKVQSQKGDPPPLRTEQPFPLLSETEPSDNQGGDVKGEA